MPKLQKITIVMTYDTKEDSFEVANPFVSDFNISQTMNLPTKIQIDASAIGGLVMTTRKFDDE